jgi:hypothetical protein
MYWYNLQDEQIGPVAYCLLKGNDWESYHKAKEIRPENAGELWQFREDNEDKYVVMYTSPNSLYLTNVFTRLTKEISQVIHNQNGWKRLFPVVEEEDIERIVIEGVQWRNHRIGLMYPIGGACAPKLKRLDDKPPMKMILEIPKEGI